jgi:hypothetical protein
MAVTVKVRGKAVVMRNLKKAMQGIDSDLTRVLMETGVTIREQSMRQAPVDTGNLINSSFGPELKKLGGKTVAVVGYQASYAPLVHEAVGKTFRKPGAKAKFLEDPLMLYANKIRPEVLKRLRHRFGAFRPGK